MLLLLYPTGLLYSGLPTLFLIALTANLAFIAINYSGVPGWFASPDLFLLLTGFTLLAIFITAPLSIWYAIRRGSYVKRWYNRWPIYLLATIAAITPNLFFEFGSATRAFEQYEAFSVSMAPTIEKNEQFLADQRRQISDNITAGDIIVWERPGALGERWFKRVIGMPGDSVRLVDGVPEINGVRVRQDIVGSRRTSAFGQETLLEVRLETLASGRAYRVLREPELASGQTTELLKLKDNEFFLLGDFRENSRDSRHSVSAGGTGPIARASIIGLVTGIYWSRDFDRIGMTMEEIDRSGRGDLR